MTKEITQKDELTEFLLYTSSNGEIKVEAFLHNENIWLTQKRMAELFGKGRSTITEHLQNIFNEGELEEDLVSRNFRHTTQHGAIKDKTQTVDAKFYNLDAISSVGYRVNSSKKAERKAFIEYDEFNKTQKIDSDFEKEIKRLANDN